MTARRALIVGLVAASVVFIVVQLEDGWGRIRDQPLPGALPIALALISLFVGQVVIGEGMVRLGAGLTTPASLRWGFHVSQPAKYVPLGVAHAAGAVTALVGQGVQRVPAGVIWVIHTGSLIVAGLSIGLLGTSALGWPIFVSSIGVFVPLLLDRRLLTFVLERSGRFVSALGPELVPGQSRLVVCGSCAAAGIALHGLAYAVLVGAIGTDQNPVGSVAAYCLAVGISIATPLPGGLGAREAILLALSTAPAGEAIVPVLLVRLLLVGAELVLWVIASARRPSPRRAVS